MFFACSAFIPKSFNNNVRARKGRTKDDKVTNETRSDASGELAKSL